MEPWRLDWDFMARGGVVMAVKVKLVNALLAGISSGMKED
jgi:hypothetical protein